MPRLHWPTNSPTVPDQSCADSPSEQHPWQPGHPHVQPKQPHNFHTIQLLPQLAILAAMAYATSTPRVTFSMFKLPSTVQVWWRMRAGSVGAGVARRLGSAFQAGKSGNGTSTV